MRAAFVEDLISQEQYLLTGDLLHHLVKVVRIETGEELLLLNGKGLSVVTVVAAVSKRSLELRRISEKHTAPDFHIDLLLGIPKKEALELSLKEAVELGFRRIFLVRAAFSQNRVPEEGRIKSLLISALEQSNSSYLPEVRESGWEEIPWNDYGTVLFLDSQTEENSLSKHIATRNLLIVGPEGGFSPEELALIRARDNVESLLLPVPIMRTPTALAAGAGVLLQRLMS